jgi:hypothetical protein
VQSYRHYCTYRVTRDAPDTDLAGYPANPRAG